MAKPINYSKWDHIEISDDEDDTHPNIDTPSLFRWRHQARVERMEQEKHEKEEFAKGYTEHQRKVVEIKKKLTEAEEKTAAEELSKMKLELSEMEKQEAEFRKKEEELKKKERLAPLNIDTICHDGKSRTIISKDKPRPKDLTDDEKFERQQTFTKENEKLMKKFGLFRRYEDTQEFLLQHPHLACEETANYMVIWCINLEMEEKHNLMEHVSHQTIVMQFILELAKTLDTDPRACIKAFFSRITLAEKQYMDAFTDELESFRERIRNRAQVKLDEAMKEVEEEERKKRLGPGGLDPVEVFETLPKELQDCFESKDVGLLQKVLMEMPKDVAEEHLKRCIDSGLWVANAGDAQEGAAAGDGVAVAEDEENVYSEPDH